MTAYADFKSYVGRHVWRDGDDVFESDVEQMILQAEARLQRELKIKRRQVTATGTATSWQLTYPDDHWQTISFMLDQYGEFKSTTAQKMREIRALIAQAGATGYNRYNEAAKFEIGFDVDTTTGNAYTWQYFARLPAFASDDASWVVADYYDLYLYAVLAETPIYLREEQRQAVINAEYQDRLARVIQDEAERAYTGTLRPNMPSRVA